MDELLTILEEHGIGCQDIIDNFVIIQEESLSKHSAVSYGQKGLNLTKEW